MYSCCKNKRSILPAVLLVLALFLSGCASMQEKERLDDLDTTTNAYSVAIRWGNFETAVGFLAPSAMPDDSYLRSLGKIRISSYDVIKRQLSDNKAEASQTVEVGYYYVDRLVEKKLIDRQVWKYDSAKKRWLLYSGMPDF